MRVLDTFKKRHYACQSDCELVTELRWGKDTPPTCSVCDLEMMEYVDTVNPTTSVIGDECDVTIRHGACWPDGTPRHYSSKQEIKRVAYEQGWTQWGNTPKPNPRLEEKLARNRE